MRINTNFKLRKIAGETIVVNQGTSHTDVTQIISLNSSAVLLWNELSNKEFTLDDATVVLLKTYDIDKDRASKDASSWIDKLKGCNIIDE